MVSPYKSFTGVIYASSASCRPLGPVFRTQINKLASLLGGDLIGTWLFDRDTIDIDNLSNEQALQPSMTRDPTSPPVWNAGTGTYVYNPG